MTGALPVFADLSERRCPVCGSGAAAKVVATQNLDPDRLGALAFASRKPPELMHYRLVLCGECDTLYANPAPDAEAIGRAYVQAAFDTGDESGFAAATYRRVVERLLDRLPASGGALDIGTGDGAFLRELLALGFEDVVGVEPSAAPVLAAEPDVRDRIRPGVFRGADFEPGRFRLITVFQTIEHVPDPMALCREALTLLRPGGALLLVAHDRGAVVNRALGSRSPIMDVQHLQLFSRRSARELLTRAGFDPVGLSVLVNRYPLGYWLRLAPVPQRDRIAALADRAGLLDVPVSLRVGNLAAVGFRP